MPKVTVYPNPWCAAKASSDMPGEMLLRTCLERLLNTDLMATPIIVFVNGEPTLRGEWDQLVTEDDKVTVVHLVAGAALPAMQIIMTIASIVVAGVNIAQAKMLSSKLKAGTGLADPAPVYALAAKSNTAKLQQPIEVAYGRNRLWPSYVTNPTSKYSWSVNTGYKQSQELFQYFCIGQGAFDVHSVKLGDSPITTFPGVSYEVVHPGASATLTPRVNHVVTEASGVVLTLAERFGGYVMSPVGVVLTSLEIDIRTTQIDDGYIVTVELYPIDAEGRLLNLTPTSFDVGKQYNNNTYGPDEIVVTYTIPLLAFPASRFKAFVKLTSINVIVATPVITMHSLRGIYAGSWRVYTDKTMLVVRLATSDVLNDTLKTQVNVVATRKLRTKHKSGSSFVEVFQPSRSVVWAAYDALTNPVYGGNLPEEYIHLDELCELDQFYQTHGITFDSVFNQKSTVKAAVDVIARAGRARVGYSGSQLTLVRDSAAVIPMGMFSTENMIEGSLSWNVKLPEPTETDEVLISYIDPDSGAQLQARFTKTDTAGQNPKTVDIQGLSSSLQAFREGAYEYGQIQYTRETYNFKTGLEGYIPRIGDTVVISWPMPSFGSSGVVDERMGDLMYLSQPVTFIAGKKHFLYLRRDDGTVAGPYEVSEGATTTEIVLQSSIDIDVDFRRLDRDPVLYTFGSEEAYAKHVKVTLIEPSDNNVVELTCVNYDPRVYAFDEASEPADVATSVTPPPPFTPISDLKVVALGTIRTHGAVTLPIMIYWSPKAGAMYYTISTYIAGVRSQVYQGTASFCRLELIAISYVQMDITYTTAAGESPAALWFGTNLYPDVLLSPSGIDFTFSGDLFTIGWNTVIDAEAYRVVFKKLGGITLRTVDITDNRISYTQGMLKADDPLKSCRSFTVEVQSMREGVLSGTTVMLADTNPPAIPPSFAMNRNGASGINFSWSADTSLVTRRYELYLQVTPAYTATPIDIQPCYLVYSGTDNSFKQLSWVLQKSFVQIAFSIYGALAVKEWTHQEYGYGALITVLPALFMGTVYEQVFFTNLPGADPKGVYRATVIDTGSSYATLFVKGVVSNTAGTAIAASQIILSFVPAHGPSDTPAVRGALIVYDGWTIEPDRRLDFSQPMY